MIEVRIIFLSMHYALLTYDYKNSHQNINFPLLCPNNLKVGHTERSLRPHEARVFGGWEGAIKKTGRMYEIKKPL